MIENLISSIKSKFHQVDRNAEPIIKLNDLNTECLFLILENLSIVDLINLSQVNRRFSVLAVDVFRRQFSSYEIKIVKDRSIGHLPVQSFVDKLIDDFVDRTALEKEDKSPSKQFENHIEIYDFDLTLSLLKQFGAVIRNLTIHTQKLQLNHSEIINKYTNKFCADSLIKFDLAFINSRTLKQFGVPLNECEEFSCSIDVYEVVDETPPLNQLFPKLKRLSLFMMSDIDYSFIDCYYPNLEHLTVKGLHTSRFETAIAMEKLIEKNPQIRSIELSIFVPVVIKMVQKLLPNLEHLILSMSNIGGYAIHFEHVKVFEMKLPSDGTPARITFGKLEELHIHYSDDQCNDWIKFLKNHQNISRFHIQNHKIEEHLHEQFERITAEIPNLMEMSIISGRKIEIDAFIRFIESHKKLTEFEFIPSTQNDMGILQNRFGIEWTIDYFVREKRNGLRLRKKNV